MTGFLPLNGSKGKSVFFCCDAVALVPPDVTTGVSLLYWSFCRFSELVADVLFGAELYA